MQSFHLRDSTPPNSHNRSTKEINDMSMSVRDGKISSGKVGLSLRVVTTVLEGVVTRRSRWYTGGA